MSKEPKKPKEVDGYFPNTPPSLFTFLANQLFRSMEREHYLYQRLQEQGLLNEEDIKTLSGLSDWQRTPTFEAEIRDKAINQLNKVVSMMIAETQVTDKKIDDNEQD